MYSNDHTRASPQPGEPGVQILPLGGHSNGCREDFRERAYWREAIFVPVADPPLDKTYEGLIITFITLNIFSFTFAQY